MANTKCVIMKSGETWIRPAAEAGHAGQIGYVGPAGNVDHLVPVVNRPCVARAVLQTPSSLIH